MIVDGRFVYGIRAHEHGQGIPWSSYSICLRPVAEERKIATVSVLMYPPYEDEHRRRPQSVDKITFGFSDGSWDSEPDAGPAFKKFSVLPTSAGTIIYMAESEPEFEEQLFGAADEQDDTTYLRISVLRHFRTPHDDQSAFAFFDLHGFLRAWEALPAYRDGSYALLFDDRRGDQIRREEAHRRREPR